MEQTRNTDDAIRKNTRLNTEKGRVQKTIFFFKKKRKFCIWFDMKERIRKRRKNKEEKKNEIKNKREKRNELIQKKIHKDGDEKK